MFDRLQKSEMEWVAVVNQEQEHLITEELQEPLAIIGMNCQFPGLDLDVEDVDALNQLLLQGITPIKDIPKERWDVDLYFDPDRKKSNKMVTRKGGFLKNVTLFDAAFFKISALEAKQMDPQHKLFLEVAVRALNHANLSLASLNGSNTGVYCGISTNEYSQLNHKENIQFNAYTAIGSAPSAASGRLSHFLNLKGPSMAVDTACSSSLSALYLAATALRAKQCDMALIGGVHLNLCPEGFIGFSQANMLSATGQCSSFDKSADGFACSEGCGVLVVQRLSDAIKAKNKVYAVIKSIIMNQDGDGTGLAAPSLAAQVAMHEQVLKEAQLSASELHYIEAHGSGTVLGDTVEFQAIQQIHTGHHSQDNPLIIGAVKSNLGHTISSSGIASILKVIGAFNSELIPPNLHYSEPNSEIHPNTIPALFPVTAHQFPHQKHKKRYAQVDNFSFSGTNVSAILAEGLDDTWVKVTSDDTNNKCFVLSAHSEHSLKHMLAGYIPYLTSSSASLEDICHTLIHCRDQYRFRCAIIAANKDELVKKLELEDYEVKRVTINPQLHSIPNEAEQIYKAFLSGAQIKLNEEEVFFNKVLLPLYIFDRKPYWHQARQARERHWHDELIYSSKEEQISFIIEIVRDLLRELVHQEDINGYQDFDELGLDAPRLESLKSQLQSFFNAHPVADIPSFMTIDKLAHSLQSQLFPAPVQRQPIINVLNNEPIAIIGMSCRLPKAPSVEDFLSLLQKGESGMSDIPLDRWDNEQYYDPDPDALGKLCIRQLGLLENVALFDAEFFNISPREAKLMAPQLRIFMEDSYHALEDANLSLDTIKDSKTGVFVGIGTNEYPSVLAEQDVSLDELNIYFATGNVLNAVAGRVAYSFDFHGPIQVIDTACSSSMTAIHNACLSLQSGDCDLALAGGVNILLSPSSNITLSKARMLSPESQCKTFSDDADGYARSEGSGILVLKRLSTALKDNDTVLAVIKGSAINSDGKSGGFTVPNGTAQEEVIRSALAKAQLVPADIDYIEAHGTGTPLADPIEANTLMGIFADSHSPEHPLYLSSAKTNIGHAESASGVAGVIKAVLSLREKQLFKHLNFRALNPGIELKNTIIPFDTMPWYKENGLRAVGISSFGFSGANAHVIIQEAEPLPQERRTLPAQCILVLSAKSKESLELLLQRYSTYLSETQDSLADICYTAATCRAHFLFRVALIAHSTQEAAALIKEKKYTIHTLKKEHSSIPHYSSLSELQEGYLHGYRINWDDYYHALDCALIKVKLPLYPFAAKEYWYGEKGKLKDSPLQKEWCFQLQWQPLSYDKNNIKELGANWLLIGSSHLAAPLIAQGLTIYVENAPYQLESLDGIIFAMGLDGQSVTAAEDILSMQQRMLKTLLHWVNELHQRDISLQLIVLTSHAIAELKGTNHCDASLVGFCKTLALELPQFQTILIDVDTSAPASCAAHIIQEIKHNHGLSYEHVVGYRENKRLVSRLKRAVVEEVKRPLLGQGRYLITGGTGGLGLVTAQALLAAGAKELILVSRTINKEDVKNNIKHLEAYHPGRIIRTVSVDVTDKNKLAHLLSELNTDGQLKGIVHAAGAAIKAPLTEHQDEDVDYLLDAKVKGAWNLHELSKNDDLDFFIVYSSVSSVFGSNKESVYSGANSCLDLLIAERHRLGLVGSSVQWGPWGEVGMAKKRSRDQRLKNALINNEQGYRFIKYLIGSPMQELCIISPEYLQFMLDFVPQPQPLFYKQLEHDLIHRGVESDTHLSSWLKTYYALNTDERFSACKEMITDQCKAILELPATEDLDENEGFFEIGFDSLMIAELASELKKKLEPAIKIMVNIGFNYPTITKLAHYIDSELNQQVAKQKGTATPVLPAMEEIAIIGMSCSFPQAPDLAAFERLLDEGKSAITKIPTERWDNSLYYDANVDAPGKSYVTKLGLTEHIKEFDASFFGISPREARFMDPQQRLFLECCYTAIEHANYPLSSINGSTTGVFAGVGPNEYFAQLEQSGMPNEELSAYSITGNVLNLIAGRVAYTFDFKGPSLSVDTACSSSLVAIHYACQSLKSHEVDYALAGGVNVLLLPESNITLCKARALSPEGECKTFDESADGYVRAEGCGVLFLKRLSDARRDKDTIYAVIKGSAVNNDGKSGGLTVPHGGSQEEVMRKALKQSNLVGADIGYIEAHGTGTPLGDPIEVHAINAVYGDSHTAENPLYLGAVKTNIGHLESASGVAGVIKTVLSLNNKKIYKHLNFKRLNPNIHLNDTRIPLHTLSWQANTPLRAAGVNAFGFSGTNAHVILQEYINSSAPTKHTGTYLLVLSTKSKFSLEQLVNKYQEYLASTSNDFADICFTAATCRNHYPYRLAVAASSAQEAMHYLINGTFALSYGEDNTLNVTNPILSSLLLAYLKGKEVDWSAFYNNLGDDFSRVPLPTYSFERVLYWLNQKNTAMPLAPKLISSPSLSHRTTTFSSALLATLKAQTQKERITTLERILRDSTAQVLEMDVTQITTDANLFAMGLDSLMAVEIRNKIHDQLRCPTLSLSMEYFLNDPQIGTIALKIANELNELLNTQEEHDPVSAFLEKEQCALCDFQYNFWALSQYTYSFNIGMQFRLKGALNRDYFEQAFAAVIKRHGAFWTDFDDKVPVQRINRQGALRIRYKDYSTDTKSQDLNTLFTINSAAVIPLDQQPLIRIFLYKINDSLHEVQLIIPHIIAEGRSCDVLLAEFTRHYETLLSGQELASLPEDNNYFHYVQYSNAQYVKNLTGKERFWKNYNKNAKYLYFGDWNHLPDAAVRQEQYLYNYRMPTEVVEQFMAWHSAKNFNVSTGLIALCHIVFYQLGIRDKLPLTLIHTGREGSDYSNSIGLFAQYKKINNIINKNNQFIDCIESIEEQLLLTAPYQKSPNHLKDKGTLGERLLWGEYAMILYKKWRLTKRFKHSGLHPLIVSLYINYLSRVGYSRLSSSIKYSLNRWFGLSIPIQKPKPLHALISITPSFFVKHTVEMNIADLNVDFPNHYAYADRPVGNRSLWIYFSKDQNGQYQLSLNGPITKECKDEIASQFNRLMAKILSDDSLIIRDLIE